MTGPQLGAFLPDAVSTVRPLEAGGAWVGCVGGKLSYCKIPLSVAGIPVGSDAYQRPPDQQAIAL